MIYVRQSTVAQVRNNTESTTRQYGLAQQAARLGWPDPGSRSSTPTWASRAAHAGNREGFKDLMGRVCLGEVGGIFGLEVSRLARSSADLSKLLELARLTDTVVIDADGIYDLSTSTIVWSGRQGDNFTKQNCTYSTAA